MLHKLMSRSKGMGWGMRGSGGRAGAGCGDVVKGFSPEGMERSDHRVQYFSKFSEQPKTKQRA